MKVKFIDNLSYQTYPITEDMLEIDVELLHEIGKTKQYNALTNDIVDYTPPEDNSALINEKISRMEELRKDFVQAELGLVVPNLEERKTEYIQLLQQVRTLQGKPPREII